MRGLSTIIIVNHIFVLKDAFFLKAQFKKYNIMTLFPESLITGKLPNVVNLHYLWSTWG